ncbi:MAG: hypothetical protein DRK00_00990 [Thermoprotei archaeon]|nr:MAG: hypothetical protein DRK00_00990 [Thermoprotei archaeon]
MSSVDVCVIGLYFGAPASVMTLGMLIAAGIHCFLAVGEADAIHPSLKIGDALLPSWGLREEGTGYHYMPANHVPTPSRYLFAKLKGNVKRLKGRKRIKVAVGGVWSTELLSEKRAIRPGSTPKEVLGVDKESTALMCVAEYRGVELAVAPAISDELYGERWVPGFKLRKLMRTEALLVKAALKTLTECA